MFDDLILLKSGRIVYYGSAQQVTDFFAEAGFPCPDKTNPADHILDVITIVPTDPNSAGDVALAEAKLEELRNRRTELEIAAGPESSVQAVKAIHKNERSSWLHQFITLFRRSVQEQRRSPEILWTLIIQNIVMAVLIGTVFLQIGTGQPATTRILPVIFFCVINQGVFSSLMTINSFPKVRCVIFTNE
jgi:ATP-binding cassette subfamily G (WHITE) protein 2